MSTKKDSTKHILFKIHAAILFVFCLYGLFSMLYPLVSFFSLTIMGTLEMLMPHKGLKNFLFVINIFLYILIIFNVFKFRVKSYSRIRFALCLLLAMKLNLFFEMLFYYFTSSRSVAFELFISSMQSNPYWYINLLLLTYLTFFYYRSEKPLLS